MTTIFKKAAIASVCALALGVSFQASARTVVTDFGQVEDWAGQSVAVKAGVSFDDVFKFSLSQAYAATVGAQSLTVNGFAGVALSSLSLYQGAFTSIGALNPAFLVGSVPGSVSSTGSYDLSIAFPSLAANTNYFLVASGKNISSINGGYTAQIQLAPVPEPETYAMLLAGLGVMGFVARHKSKSKTV